MTFTVINGNNIDVLKTYPDNHFDSVVTDPPYGIDFLGKAWDANTGALETYQECLRVLKPGGHILAFSAARTYHHLAITLEQAGFEIRDQIMWIYSSGFPKSQDVGRSIQRSLGVKEKKAHKHNVPRNGGAGDTKHYESDGQIVVTDPEAKQWEGWGTALKPAHEPIALARKPMKTSIAKNCQQWGVGALNIDATRVPYESLKDMEAAGLNWNKTGYETGGPRFVGSGDEHTPFEKPKVKEKRNNINSEGRFPSNVLGEILQEDYQKYFYCPKVSRKERHMGFELPPAMFGGVQGCYDENGERFAVGFDNRSEGKPKKKKHDPLAHITTNPNGMFEHGGGDLHAKQAEEKKNGNNHPTVKPVALMEYLIKLITPPGGTVLDPFNGSGSTGMAAVGLGYDYVGIDLDPNYVDISIKRIEAWIKRGQADNTFEELFENSDETE